MERQGDRSKRVWGLVGGVLLLVSGGLRPAFSIEPLVVDDFEQGTMNKLGGRCNTYVMEPSRALALRIKEQHHAGTGALMIKYDKKAIGGPHDSGGWCGYYTLLKTGARYFDATPYQAITFWVKGATGEENFVVGVADQHWDEVGDSVKSEPIGKYLPSGALTTEWQKATVPLNVFMVEMSKISSVIICFEGSLYPNGASKGTIYLDDLVLE